MTDEQDKRNVILERIQRRLYVQNKNFLLACVGATGSGKSYFGLRLCSEIDPEFNIERVVFDAESLMKLLNSGTLHKGSAILWDETGVGLSNRTWFSVSNRVINYVLQTFRQDNLMMVFTVPDISFIDNATRKLFHALVETQRIDYANNVCYVKYLEIQTNTRIGKTYYKYPRFIENGKKKTITTLRIHKPSVKLVHEYEKRKKIWRDDLGNSVLKTLQGEKLKTIQIKQVNLIDIVEKIKQNPERFKRTYNKRTFYDIGLIMSTFSLGRARAEAVRGILAKEGDTHGM